MSSANGAGSGNRFGMGAGGLKEVMATVAALRAQKNGESKAVGSRGLTHPPTPRLRRTGRREDANNDELPEEKATEQPKAEESSLVVEEKSGLVAAGQGESCLAAGLDDGTPDAGTDAEAVPVEAVEGEVEAGTNDELPQKNTKEHEKSSGVDSPVNSEESGLVVAGQAGSCLAVELDAEAAPVEAVDKAEAGDCSGGTRLGEDPPSPAGLGGQAATEGKPDTGGGIAGDGSGKSGLVIVGQGESDLAAAVESSGKMPPRSGADSIPDLMGGNPEAMREAALNSGRIHSY